MAKVVWGFTCSIDGIIAGRDGYNAAPAQCDERDERDELTAEAHGGAWSGAEFILTHLIDERQVFVAPVFLGDGIRICELPGGRRVDWELVEIYTDSPRSVGRVNRTKGRVRGGGRAPVTQ